MLFDRREFLVGSAAAGLAAATASEAAAAAPGTVTLPMENGTRPLVAFPQKRPLIMLAPRPPLLETPFRVFDEGVLTPNDAFFVRWHLAGIPTSVDGAAHRIRVHGQVKHPLSLSVEDLRTKFEPVSIVAVNQCSGNSRGLFAPRVPGGEWDNGAMGNARWTGVRLTDVLAKAGLKDGVRQIRFHGLEGPVLPTTPPFVKALSVDDILDNGDILIAYEMNGEPLPLLNGYPVRLIVPGWFATYWMKMLSDLEAIDTIDDNFWMKTAYRIPETPGGTVKPTDTGYPTVPINRMPVRSFVTNVADDDTLARKRSAESPLTAEAASRPSTSLPTAARRGARRASARTTDRIRFGAGRAICEPTTGSTTCWRAGRERTAARPKRRSRCGIRGAICATSSRPTE